MVGEWYTTNYRGLGTNGTIVLVANPHILLKEVSDMQLLEGCWVAMGL